MPFCHGVHCLKVDSVTSVRFVFSHPLRTRIAHVFHGEWKMADMEKLNSFSKLPVQVNAFAKALTQIAATRGTFPTYFPKAKELGILMVTRADSYLVLPTLSLQLMGI